MDRLTVLGTGLALAVTAALLNALCAAVVALWPVQAIAFANAWAHGLDLQLIRATAPMTLPGFLYGLIGIAAIGFVVGAVYAWVYNQVRNIGRARG